MIEAKDRAAQFREELEALMKKWGAEIMLEDGRMTCYIDAIYENHECVAEFTAFSLGTYIDEGG